MNNQYLVIQDGSNRHVLLKVDAFPFTAFVRQAIERLYPDYRVVSPLEKCDGERSRVLHVWVSPNKDGSGRSGSAIDKWAIESPAKK